MLPLAGVDEQQSSNRTSPSPSIRNHLRDIAVIVGFVGVTYAVLRYLEFRENDRPLSETTTDRIEETVAIDG
ncbi:hypothetical protein [Halosolutus halophilus]|uniref:hypothetical protein n=1 Tax=Halosolutus halophilus TaxID=1552990 RepID=UPI0022350975|nr:hypothetical protein [Halosolutus halophilus]